ncbi:CRISPR-associated endoribonuclease Cas6 [Dyadobacter aurulentus]|uniref:CRISPR-associated endoribonuclease Cas6 n=1 Tax=Dyadobacter sp. UC 10 TaxID=2605428 RepID=UPI0011F0F8BA|nr:CRISPR-associated endoribonuclease Cas6 [Dyadobacter sp. UC 10]KAA0993405.1 CRISPR-associated protein Cas6 [Dyadobacter sp. UC 10]
MRIRLQLSPNTEPVPFSHLYSLTGTLHKWLGENSIHDGVSLYSFGWLHGGRSEKKALSFSLGADWNISFFDDDLARQLIKGILQEPSVAYGMYVEEIQEVEPMAFRKQHIFHTDGSAILARQKRLDGSQEYLAWDSLAANEALTNKLRWKLSLAGFTGDHLNARVAFDRTYTNPRSRKITIKGIDHKGSECPVIVEGTQEALHFAWLVGLGDLTGSGFGALQ